MNGLFVTGTDTGVGKTVVSAALMHRLRARVPVRYWKPVQTGIERDDDTATVRQLGACEAAEVFDAGVRLPRPVSPHLAARLAGRPIDMAALVAQMREADDGRRRWVVEGAGGARVPLGADRFMIDLMVALGAPVLVVARSSLGTINHTLLTLDALRSRQLPVAGVIVVGERSADNRTAIEEFGAVRVLGEMPCFQPLTADAIRGWAAGALDPEGWLDP